VKLKSNGDDGLPSGPLVSNLKIAAVHRKPGSKSVVYLQTVSGETVVIDSKAKTVTMKKEEGADVEIDATATSEADEVDEESAISFLGGLQTSGSFTMMASTAF